MTDDHTGFGGQSSGGDNLIEIDLNFESMRRFQGEFSQNLSKDGLFIDTGEPLSPGSVIRFRVILPEDFVFLEGTTVIEWIRSAEDVSDGPPGMALRFVTLSPQNQELVEQLVQDHVDAGGSPFDLDVRPVPADFPTDALEGVPSQSIKPIDESYRLTVRRTGPQVQAEALQALVDATFDANPILGEEDFSSAGEADQGALTAESDLAAQTTALDFEIVSRPTPDESREGVSEEEEAAIESEEGIGIVGDPPKLEWSSGTESSAESAESSQEVLTVPSEDEVERDRENAESLTTEPELLLTPSGPMKISGVRPSTSASPSTMTNRIRRRSFRTKDATTSVFTPRMRLEHPHVVSDSGRWGWWRSFCSPWPVVSCGLMRRIGSQLVKPGGHENRWRSVSLMLRGSPLFSLVNNSRLTW